MPEKPTDYSDVGQATVLSREYEAKLRYTPSTDFLVYNGGFWEESKPKAQAVAQELTTRQLEEAEAEIRKTTDEMMKNGAWELLASMGPKKAAAAFNSEQARSFQKYENATTYRNYAIKRRDSKYISAALKESHPMLEIDQRQLDSDEFLLNTPTSTYDLRLGLVSAREHTATDFITKQTTVDPADEGMDIWQDALETFFCDDADLIRYVQEIAGLSAIGKVCVEALIIAYGEGRNGKSTFWNTLSRVLGTYSGNMSADTLTVGCKRNVKPELAEAKGKRLIIAAELEEGMRLSTSNVKQLCSTDEIYAEKKYKDPFSYVPSHTLVLYTNHLPKVGAIDAGTWRRLIVIPFNAKIEGKSDVKNYADFLFEKAGGAILKWIMVGAKRVIDNDYHMLTILASYAQEESRSASENQKWRIKRNFEEGMPWNGAMLGYRLKDGRYEIVPKEAALVRRIYNEYLAGDGYQAVAKRLTEEGVPSRFGGKWNQSVVSKILSNYTYTGNLLLQKTFRENHITKKTVINHGELPKYHAEDAHDAIISIETFHAVQTEKARRAAQFNKKPAPRTTYPFTSLLVCDICGKNYRRKTTKTGIVWVCGTFNTLGKSVCASKQIPEATLQQVTAEVLGVKAFTREQLHSQVQSIRVCNGNILVFCFKDGSKVTRTWKDRSRAESWTDEMKEAARRKTLERSKHNA